MFQDCTPEEKYFSALRLLQGWDDNRIKNENLTQEELENNTLQIIETKDKKLFKEFCKQIIKDIVREIMRKKTIKIVIQI